MTTPAEKVTKLIIDRKKWARGTGGSALLEPDGTMCCLGFYAKALGYTDEEISCRSTPLNVKDCSLFPRWLVNSATCPTNPCGDLMEKNDEPVETYDAATDNYEATYSEEEREADIAKTFKEAGDVDVEFVS